MRLVCTMTTTGVSKMGFCWIIEFENTFFSISTPENVNLDNNVSILSE